MSTAFNPPPFAAAAAAATTTHQPAFAAQTQPLASTVPDGTFIPGTKVQVGGHRVVIEKYLSEGGFAHVYLVRLPKAVDGDEKAVLKRVAVPDKDALASMRTEVETMKKLKGRHPIVTYIDSHASQLKGGGYEVFLLMEYCNGGGLIDFMNTRLQNRLTEPEVLKIFSDVAQGVACMHYLKPPLLHRDLKVENVLIKTSGSSRRYKLCDFGSTAPPRPAATNAVEGRLIEEDVQKNTTLQYRSPEMIDVYRKQPIDEKSDIWALGVLLYKLCYYKTPFEEQGQMAILNASFKFPAYPSFSDRIKKLIASMLREDPQQRPNIYQAVREVSHMRGTDVPIKDIYTGRTQSEARRNQHLPSPKPNIPTPPVVGAFHAPSTKEKPSIPDITPMRRGRPTKAGGDAKIPKPSPSPLRGAGDDPWMILDSAPVTEPDAAPLADASIRFPALDDFSLLHDSGTKFAFDPNAQTKKKPSHNISQRVTNALADEAFVQPNAAPTTSSSSQPSTSVQKAESRLKPAIPESTKLSTATTINTQQPSAQRMGYVSTGTMTSPRTPSPPLKVASASARPVFRFSSSTSERSFSRPQGTDASEGAVISLRAADTVEQKRPQLRDHRSKSQIWNSKSTETAQHSLELGHKPIHPSGIDSSMHRSRSANAKAPRTNSVQAPSKPNILRRLSRERSNSRINDGTAYDAQEASLLVSPPNADPDAEDEGTKIDSNVDFLKAMEEEDSAKRKEKRLSSGSRHIKRASMPSVSLSGTKNLLAGRFGDAFKRFETNTSNDDPRDSSRSPVRGANDLTPIAGSEATDGRSDDGNDLEESEEVPPEMRRELERRRLSQEEKRVAEAAAAYRQRLAEGGKPTGPNNKAASIQSKVQSLLDDNGRGSPSPTKTAFGYGRFTDSLDQQVVRPPRTSSRQILLKPSSSGAGSQLPPRPVPQPTNASPLSTRPNPPNAIQPSHPHDHPRHSAPPTERPFTRPPNGPPPRPQAKPQNLRTGEKPPQSPAKPTSLTIRKPVLQRPEQQQSQPEVPTDGANDDWEANFSKRYPDLAGLEMVETEIDRGGNTGQGAETRMKDV